MNRFWRNFIDNLKTATFIAVALLIIISTALCFPIGLGGAGGFYPLVPLFGVPLGIVALSAWMAVWKSSI